jgi:dienelactone hydrolase
VRARLSVVAAVVVGSVLTATGASSTGSAVNLVVSPSSVLLDQPVNVRLTGVRPGRKIALDATTQDALGKRWRSHLVFRASSNGVVDTHAHMRLFWGMEPVAKPLDPQPFIPSVGPSRVTIRAVAGRRTLATGAVVRRGTTTGVSRTDATLAVQGFVGSYFTPSAGPVGPAVLQIGGALGSYSYFPAALLAGHGYRTLSLAYFKEPGLPQTLKEIPLEYFAKALRWLGEQPGVDRNRILVYGVSRGAEAALLLGATYPELVHGVIASSPSADVIGAYPGPGAAWTLDSKPVPEGPIPVWQIVGPVLAFGGGKDLYYSSAYAVDEIVERAHEHGRHNFVGHVYPDAGGGVGFGIPNLPVYGRVIKLGNHYIGVGGTPGANTRAWAASWPLVLDFIRLMPY